MCILYTYFFLLSGVRSSEPWLNEGFSSFKELPDVFLGLALGLGEAFFGLGDFCLGLKDFCLGLGDFLFGLEDVFLGLGDLHCLGDASLALESPSYILNFCALKWGDKKKPKYHFNFITSATTYKSDRKVVTPSSCKVVPTRFSPSTLFSTGVFASISTSADVLTAEMDDSALESAAAASLDCWDSLVFLRGADNCVAETDTQHTHICSEYGYQKWSVRWKIFWAVSLG